MQKSISRAAERKDFDLRKENRMNHSIVKSAIRSMVLTIMAAILIIEISSFFLIQQDGERARELFGDSVEAYGNYWENKLDETADSMLGFIGIETGVMYRQLCESDRKLKVEIAKTQLHTQIQEMSAHYGNELTTFVYVPDRDIYFSANEKGLSYANYQEMKQAISKYIQEHMVGAGDKWKILMINDTPYIFKIYHMYNGYIGSLYSAERVLDGLYDKKADWFLEILDSDKQNVLEKGEKYAGKTVSYESQLKGTEITISVSVKSGHLYNNTGFGLLVFCGTLFLAMILITVVWGREARRVFFPLEKLRLAMERYSEGEMDTRLKVLNNGSQIDLLYKTYNNMADQIQNLKIQVYEKELERQRINSHFLKVQIQPHFYTNILNLIYGMAQMKDFRSIQQLSLVSGKYFRYLLGQKGTFVPLAEELNCLNSYAEIQRYRYQDKFEASMEIQEGLEEQLVLPMTVQTFFANSLKHNIMRVPLLKVKVSVRSVEKEGLKITIMDNGVGFDPEILKRIENGESIEENGEHIGIQNVKERIREFYGKDGKMEIHSVPGKTEVVLYLPHIM